MPGEQKTEKLIKDNMVARKPDWLRIKKTSIQDSNIATAKLIRDLNLQTVCENAKCPNKGECYGNKTATFLILGNICTRDCTFCAVYKDTIRISAPDPTEPERITKAAQELGLEYVVITMVTRDDLEDGGAAHLVKVVQSLRRFYRRDIGIELLISDLQGKMQYLEEILDSRPTIFNHNIETVSRLYPQVRPQADYKRSLNILEYAGNYTPDIPRKSGFMLGLGEREDEVIEMMQDLRKVGVNILTIGQYLAPSSRHLPVRDYITPEKFEFYRQQALETGFEICYSGPFVRSSYKAREAALDLFQHHREDHDAKTIKSNL